MRRFSFGCREHATDLAKWMESGAPLPTNVSCATPFPNADSGGNSAAARPPDGSTSAPLSAFSSWCLHATARLRLPHYRSIPLTTRTCLESSPRKVRLSGASKKRGPTSARSSCHRPKGLPCSTGADAWAHPAEVTEAQVRMLVVHRAEDRSASYVSQSSSMGTIKARLYVLYCC